VKASHSWCVVRIAAIYVSLYRVDVLTLAGKGIRSCDIVSKMVFQLMHREQRLTRNSVRFLIQVGVVNVDHDAGVVGLTPH